MQQYADIVTDLKGNVIKAASVRVLLADKALATIYDANDPLGAPTGNPITASATGSFAFYAANGDYLVEISVAGKVFATVPVTLYDVRDDPQRITRDDLAADDGSSLIGNGTETVADSLNALQLADYTALRAYAGPRKSVYVTGTGIAGMFVLRGDLTPATTTDNGGTRIVGVKVWDRQTVIAADPRWFGAVGNGVVDDTVAIDKTIANSGALDLSYGSFVYNGAQSAYVSVYGPGKVVKTDGNPHPRFVQRVGSSGFVSDLLSYTGVLNLDYTGDNGARLYLLPKNKITSGTGGAIKIFGDAYHLGQEYRDFGIYFSANQGGDTGQAGNGVFWMNSKIGPNQSGAYGYGNVDIGWSFQDGAVVAGRVCRLGGGTADDRAHWVFGSGLPSLANAPGIVAEFKKSVVFASGYGLYFFTNNGAADTKIAPDSTGARVEFTWQGVRRGYFATSWVIETRLVQKMTSASSGTTLDATTGNSVELSHASATTITGLTGGATGQEFTLIFTNSNVTLQNNASVKLAGGVNFAGTADDTLTLICNGLGVWREKCRSVN